MLYFGTAVGFLLVELEFWIATRDYHFWGRVLYYNHGSGHVWDCQFHDYCQQRSVGSELYRYICLRWKPLLLSCTRSPGSNSEWDDAFIAVNGLVDYSGFLIFAWTLGMWV
jgi:hypothetical protein